MRKILFLFFFLTITLVSIGKAEEDTVEYNSVRRVLNTYFTELSQIYPHYKKREEIEQSPLKASFPVAKFWKTKEKDISLPHLQSLQFFAKYRPDQWKVVKTQIAGDFAKATVNFTIADPLQRRQLERAGKDLKREALYSLIKVEKKWFLTDFVDPKAKLAREELKALAAKREVRVDTADLSGKDPEETVNRYLQNVLRILIPEENSKVSHAKFPQANIETASLWEESREATKSRAQNISQLSLVAPFTWTIDQSEQNKTGMILLTSIHGKTPEKMKFLKDLKLRIQLVQEESIWKIQSITRG